MPDQTDLLDDEDELQPVITDSDRPFTPAEDSVDDVSGDPDTRETPPLSPTHPSTDTNLDSQELYDEGEAGAAEAEEPHDNDSVVDYTPPQSPDPGVDGSAV